MALKELLTLCPLFFFNDTATTEIYTLSLHDALPIWNRSESAVRSSRAKCCSAYPAKSKSRSEIACWTTRSEEHTSELQSRQYLVCRLLLEKKQKSSYHLS